jgi:predicted DNA-binding antitoxin AbrB/MazE fold protein
MEMTQTVEVIYEDNVLKPISPIEGLKEHDRRLVILCPRPVKKSLRELVGTLTHEEAEAMQKLIEEEFERIEGEW